ncbi:hypothetical protein BLD44_001255 [Mastigocladus laminosus UU774]|nr:hypothetical protein BLD44_001255 [Mastigocladus laminosus UU774]
MGNGERGTGKGDRGFSRGDATRTGIGDRGQGSVGSNVETRFIASGKCGKCGGELFNKSLPNDQ